MKYFATLFILFTLLLFSCNTTNKSVTNTSENKTQMVDAKKMIEAGFLEGVIVTSKKEGDCPITIQVEGKDGAYFLDPINITEEYKIDGEQVWFTFGGLRMMNRCEKANPISIIEIQKRN